MRSPRPVLITLALAVFGLVLQATLFRRFTWLVPDLVVLVVILATLSLRGEVALVIGFLAGALVDVSLASSVLGSAGTDLHGRGLSGPADPPAGGFRTPGGGDLGGFAYAGIGGRWWSWSVSYSVNRLN